MGIKFGCGQENCFMSTSIDEVTLTFGSHGPDDHGYFDMPCYECATAWKRKYPTDQVWPWVDGK